MQQESLSSSEVTSNLLLICGVRNAAAEPEEGRTGRTTPADLTFCTLPLLGATAAASATAAAVVSVSVLWEKGGTGNK
jgi:hypothetical protein